MRIGLERIRSIRPGVCALLLLPLGCSPVTVNTSTAPSEAFSTRHTYAWEPNPQIGGALDDLIVGQDIHAAVNQALEARGSGRTSTMRSDRCSRTFPHRSTTSIEELR